MSYVRNFVYPPPVSLGGGFLVIKKKKMAAVLEERPPWLAPSGAYADGYEFFDSGPIPVDYGPCVAFDGECNI